MKTKLLLFSFLLFSNFFVFSQNVKLSNNLIQQYEEAQMKSLKNDVSNQEHLWLTPLLKEAFKHWGELTADAKQIFKKYLSRPIFSGTEQILSLGNFALHYTLDGPSGESIDPTDNNANGFPDYAENMLYKFNDIYNLYHVTTGFTVPPSDGGDYNGAYYDIYVSGDLAGPGVYGFVAPESLVGDNTNSSAITEVDAATSFMVMRNNYTGFGDETIAMEVTAAHEYMHATQFGYTTSMDTWFMESCATWSEDYAFPGDDDNLQYLMGFFGSPDVALNLANGEAGGQYDGHWYSTWLFTKYMTEHTGNSIIKNIYERNISTNSLDAINNELTAGWNSSLDQIFKQYLVANVLMTDNASFDPYIYSRATVYRDYINNHGGFNIENSQSQFGYTGTDINWNSQVDGNNRLMRLSADYFILQADRNFKIVLNPSFQTELLLLKINTNNNTISVISSSNGEINVNDNNDWNIYVPIVVRLDKNVTNTNADNYSLLITAPTVNVDEYNMETVQIYPNPVSDIIHIESTLDFDKVKIYDETGKLIREVDGGNRLLNVSDMANGMYFVSIYKNNQRVAHEKIVISH